MDNEGILTILSPGFYLLVHFPSFFLISIHKRYVGFLRHSMSATRQPKKRAPALTMESAHEPHWRTNGNSHDLGCKTRWWMKAIRAPK